MQARHSELVFDLAGEFQRVIVGVLLVQLFDDQIARRPGFLDTEAGPSDSRARYS